MALEDTSPIISYKSTAPVGTIYPLPFVFFTNSHVKLYIDGVISEDVFTISGDGSAGTAEATSTVAYTNLQTITFSRRVPYDQPIVLPGNGRVAPDTLERAYDYAVMQAQQVSTDLLVAPKALPGDIPPGGSFKKVANTTQGQDSSGNIIARTAAEEVAFLGIAAQVTAAGNSADEASASQITAGTFATQAENSAQAASASETNAATSETNAETSAALAVASVLDLSDQAFFKAWFYPDPFAGDPVITGDVVISLPGSPNITIKNSARPYAEDNAINGVGSKVSQLFWDIVNIIKGNVTDYDSSTKYGVGQTTVSNYNPITTWDAKVEPYGNGLTDNSIEPVVTLTYYGPGEGVTLTLPTGLLTNPGTFSPPTAVPFVSHTTAQTLTDSQKAQVLANIGANKSLIPSLPDGAQFLIEGDSIFSDLSVSQSSHPPRWGSFFQSSKLFTERGFIYTNSAVPGNGLVELEARFAATGAAQAVATGTATVIVCNVGVNDLAAGEMEGAPWANAAAWIADYETLAQSYQALSTSEHPVYFVACTMVKYRNKDALRKQVNDLIRTSKVFDMVVDHALILTDEDDLNFYIPNTSGGASPTDETHPNERGAYYQFREIMRRLFPEVAPLAQENLLTSFEGLYSRNGQIPRNFATLKVYADDAQASVGGLSYRDAYLKSTGEMVVVMAAPPTITTHNWTEASNSSRIQNFTTTDYAAYNEVDIQLTAFDPTRFIYLQNGHTVGTRLYLRNSTGSVTGADATHKIGIRPWATNVAEITNANGPNGMTDAISTDFVIGPVVSGTYIEKTGERVDPGPITVSLWTVYVP